MCVCVFFFCTRRTSTPKEHHTSIQFNSIEFVCLFFLHFYWMNSFLTGRKIHHAILTTALRYFCFYFHIIYSAKQQEHVLHGWDEREANEKEKGMRIVVCIWERSEARRSVHLHLLINRNENWMIFCVSTFLFYTRIQPSFVVHEI